MKLSNSVRVRGTSQGTGVRGLLRSDILAYYSINVKKIYKPENLQRKFRFTHCYFTLAEPLDQPADHWWSLDCSPQISIYCWFNQSWSEELRSPGTCVVPQSSEGAHRNATYYLAWLLMYDNIFPRIVIIYFSYIFFLFFMWLFMSHLIEYRPLSRVFC